MKKLSFILKIIACTSLGLCVQQFSAKQTTFAEENVACAKYSPEEITENVQKNLDILNEKFDIAANNKDAHKNIVAIAFGGGFGLDDQYRDEKTGRKMNDFVHILASRISKYLHNDEEFIVVFVNNPDPNIPEAANPETDLVLLDDIPTIDDKGNFFYYYSGSNQAQAVLELAEQIACTKGLQIHEVEVQDTSNDKNKISEEEVEEEQKKPKTENYFEYPQHPIALFISLQVNSNDKHTGKGMRGFYYSSDKLGEQFGKLVFRDCKNLITKGGVQDENIKVEKNDKKITTQVGKYGFPTSLIFPEYCDNQETQKRLFDEDAIDRMAMNIATDIKKFFNASFLFAKISQKNIVENGNKGILISAELEGKEADNLKNISFCLKEADSPKEKEIRQNVAVTHDGSKHTAEFKIFPNNKPEEIKDYYIKLNLVENKNENEENTSNDVTNTAAGSKTNDNELDEKTSEEEKKFKLRVPSNITNFRIKLNQNNEFECLENEVFKY